MFEDPTIEHRDEQAYAGLGAGITMDGFGVIGPMFAELIDWLAQRGIAPSASPFLRYLMIDMDNLLDVEVAVPIALTLPADERVVSGTLPAGWYVTLHYRGDEHIAANTHLQQWAAERGLRWKNSFREGRELWGGRIEISTPDGGETTVAYLVEE